MPAEYAPEEPYAGFAMALCDDHLERYDEVMVRVPHMRLLRWVERKLANRERMEEALKKSRSS